MSNENKNNIELIDGNVKLVFSPETDTGYIKIGEQEVDIDEKILASLSVLTNIVYVEQGFDGVDQLEEGLGIGIGLGIAELAYFAKMLRVKE